MTCLKKKFKEYWTKHLSSPILKDTSLKNTHLVSNSDYSGPHPWPPAILCTLILLTNLVYASNQHVLKGFSVMRVNESIPCRVQGSWGPYLHFRLPSQALFGDILKSRWRLPCPQRTCFLHIYKISTTWMLPKSIAFTFLSGRWGHRWGCLSDSKVDKKHWTRPESSGKWAHGGCGSPKLHYFPRPFGLWQKGSLDDLWDFTGSFSHYLEEYPLASFSPDKSQ